MRSICESLESIYREALACCAPERLVFDRLEARAGDKGFAVPQARFDVKLASPGKLWIFGAGKAAASMAAGGLEKLGPQVRGGVLVVPHEAPLSRLPESLQVLRASHPRPDATSIEATRQLCAAARACLGDEHVLFMLSGGASSLLCQPAEAISVQRKAEVLDALMAAGAPISELNTVRKHLSTVKGGRLAGQFRCGVTVLVLSDVMGDGFGVVGSGPLYPDATTVADAATVLEARLGVEARWKDVKAALLETPKTLPNAPRHVLVGSGAMVARSAVQAARVRLGSGVAVVNGVAEGEVSELANQYQTQVREARNQAAQRLYVAYGEPIVKGREFGRGGRSQQLALLLAKQLADQPNWAFLAAGTDGIDGRSQGAGAVVDGSTWARAKVCGLDPDAALQAFNSEPVLSRIGAQIRTGQTGNNLGDLHLLWLGSETDWK